jgi:hypothetical protein
MLAGYGKGGVTGIARNKTKEDEKKGLYLNLCLS